MKRKYNYFYKITNNINNHFYYGVHCTDNLDDGYMGSGVRLKYAYKKYGIENFTKEILKFFGTIKEAYEYESEIVTEDLTHNPDCYNIQCGGEGWNTHGLITVRDKDGNCFDVPNNDPKFVSGEYVGVTKGYGIYKNIDTGKYESIHYSDEKLKTGKYVGATKNKILLKDKNNKIYFLDKTDSNFNDYVKNNNLIFYATNKISVKDKQNNFYQISKDDPRYLSGELIPIWKNRKHTEESKKKMSYTHQINKHQQGEKNSQYGTCWIYKINENDKPINKKIKKEKLEYYLKKGWLKGRKIK